MALIEDSLRKNDKLVGNRGEADVFFLTEDGKRDIIRRFEDGSDRINLTQFDIAFSDLKIVDKADGSGVRIVVGGEKIFLAGERARDIDASDFILATPPSAAPAGPFTTQSDTNAKNDKLTGTGAADQFVFVEDGKRDVIRQFDDGTDVIDLTAFGVTYDDLSILNRANGNAVRIEVNDDVIVVRGETASNFTAEDFLF